jgi:protein SCO1/2
MVVGALVLCSAAAAAATPPFEGPRISHPARTPDFALRDQNGRLMRLSAQRGKVVMLTFMYTHCPDVCPLSAVHIQEALSRLGSLRTHVTVFAVSVDPHGDTPRAVKTFIRSHRLGPQFHYLTGPLPTLGKIWRQYDITTLKLGTPKPDHTFYVLLLDRTGKTRVLFDATAQPAAMAHDLRLLLA